MVHARYRQPGGEDVSAAAEADALEALGVAVDRWTLAPEDSSGLDAFRAAAWNRDAAATLKARRPRPDLVHVQNFFPGLSPLVHRTAAALGLPVVQTVRNWRLGCPAATRWRAGAACDACLGHPLPWPSLGRACWRGSRAATAAAAAALGLHRLLRTWERVRLFLCPSRALAAMLPPRWPQRLVPNMAADPGTGPGGPAIVFAGRLTEEKGAAVLAEAWSRPDLPPLHVYGDGPLAPLFDRPNVTWHRHRPHAEVVAAMGRARAVVVPSLWPEPFGRTVIESFACGTPVIATTAGALPELVTPGRDGLLVPPGDAAALAHAVHALPDTLRPAARATYEARFAAPVVARRLVEVYEECL